MVIKKILISVGLLLMVLLPIKGQAEVWEEPQFTWIMDTWEICNVERMLTGDWRGKSGAINEKTEQKFIDDYDRYADVWLSGYLCVEDNTDLNYSPKTVELKTSYKGLWVYLYPMAEEVETTNLNGKEYTLIFRTTLHLRVDKKEYKLDNFEMMLKKLKFELTMKLYSRKPNSPVVEDYYKKCAGDVSNIRQRKISEEDLEKVKAIFLECREATEHERRHSPGSFSDKDEVSYWIVSGAIENLPSDRTIFTSIQRYYDEYMKTMTYGDLEWIELDERNTFSTPVVYLEYNAEKKGSPKAVAEAMKEDGFVFYYSFEPMTLYDFGRITGPWHKVVFEYAFE